MIFPTIPMAPALPVWNLPALSAPPQTYPAPKELERPGLRALFYAGLPWKGKPTKVFAWVGIPEHKPGEKVPGVVLIHGGGGTASDDGVRLWVSRGYAAIAMDTTGSYPGRNMEQHADGGPRGNGENFAQIEEPLTEQWYYHAVADVALANSLLRSLPDVDPTKVGLTGLSWGGVLASTVAGVDSRFKWVAPVYGCGFMDQSEYFKPVLAAYHGEKWMSLWDPSRYLSRAKMPTLWINGTNDEYFQIGMWQQSHRLAAGPRTISLKVRMNHSGEDGERPEEILAFADSLVRGGVPLPKVDAPRRTDARIAATVTSAQPLAKAEIAFTKDTGAWSKRRWETQPATLTGTGKKRTLSGILPAGTTTWYVRVEDGKGRSVTSDFEELTTPIPTPAPLPGNTVFVAPDGNDANPGTTEKPIASLFRARELARVQPRTAPVKVVLRAGTYRLSSPLELTAADGGTEDAPVTWNAAPGERVILSGGVPITGWKTTTVNGKTAWSVTLPDVKNGSWYFRSLYGSGAKATRRQRARLPNTGFLEVDRVDKHVKDDGYWLNGRDRFYYKSGDLADWPDRTSAEIVLITQWTVSHLPITGIDTARREVTSSKFTIQDFAAKNRYWVENTRAALDQPGEWALNRETGELLYLPLPGENPKDTTLIAPRATGLVTLDRTANLTLRNLTFSHNEWWYPEGYRAAGYDEHATRTWAIQQGASDVRGTIHGTRTTNFVVDGCEIAHVGSYAVVLGGAARGNEIVRVNAFDLGAGGFRIGPSDVSKERVDQEVAIGNVVSDCRIIDGGHLFTGAVGIWLGHTQKSEIVHNEIADMYYTGISGGWVWGFGDLQPSRDNTIAWNHIHHLGKDTLGDGAGIYMLGGQPGTVIENNVVHDMNGDYASRGIYLDDGSSDMTVRGNLSYDNRTANYFQWRSKRNRVENNVFAFGKESQVELGGAIFNDGALAMNFERNILVVEPGPLFNAFDPANVQKIYQFDKNLLWRTDGKPEFPANAKAVGWDRGALSENPLFVDLAKRDFRLKSDSPAILKIGFVPVEWSKVGPRR
jgi:dienelactone hydrolase